MAYQISRLVYTSQAQQAFSEEHLLKLLHSARAKNTADSLTGLLLYQDGYFAQWIEGPPEAVDDVWRRIQQDKRHGAIELIEQRIVLKRIFPQWQMGFASNDRAMTSRLEGIATAEDVALAQAINDPDLLLDLFEAIANGRADELAEQAQADQARAERSVKRRA